MPKSQAQVQNVLDAPRGEYGGQQSDTEAHNTEIGQTQTLDGVNYTLDKGVHGRRHAGLLLYRKR